MRSRSLCWHRENESEPRNWTRRVSCRKSRTHWEDVGTRAMAGVLKRKNVTGFENNRDEWGHVCEWRMRFCGGQNTVFREQWMYVLPAAKNSETRKRVGKMLPETRRVANVSSRQLCTVNGGAVAFTRETCTLSAFERGAFYRELELRDIYIHIYVFREGAVHGRIALATKCALKGGDRRREIGSRGPFPTPRVLSYHIRFLLTRRNSDPSRFISRVPPKVRLSEANTNGRNQRPEWIN